MIKRLWIIITGLCLLLVAPAVAQDTGTTPYGGTWLARYYNNTQLEGTPILTRYESAPTVDALAGSPAPIVPNENWSALWTNAMYLDEGTYSLTVQADDGVRVYVDGNLLIDEWHAASEPVFTAETYLEQGTHNFAIEYYEGTGDALLTWNLQQVDGDVGVIQPRTPYIAVDVGTLNVRDLPDIGYGDVLFRINEGETYEATAVDQSNQWVQIDVNGTLGWVTQAYVTGFGLNNLPTLAAEPEDPATVPQVTVIAEELNVRARPTTNATIVGQINATEQYRIIGATTDQSWIQISYFGQPAWVFREYVDLDNLDDLGNDTIIDPVDPGLSDTPVVIALYDTNVRTQPRSTAAVIETIPVNDTAVIMGQSYDNRWWYVEYNGQMGWVSNQLVDTRNVTL